MSALLLVVVGWLIMIAVMIALWRWQQRTEKSGMVDVVWPISVGILAAFFSLATTSGLLSRRVLIAVLAMLWATRLSWYIWNRLKSEKDDRRYLNLREKWADQYQTKLFKFYQFQGFGALLFALPMLVAATNESPLGWLDYLGVAVWCIATTGETMADLQLKRFKANPNNQGKVCQHGLWRYSRHPNYFFEWLHWWTYVCFAIVAPWGWLTLIGPAAMLLFVLFMTGVPPAEASSLKSRGQAYRDYQQTTSVFFPWFPKSKKQTKS